MEALRGRVWRGSSVMNLPTGFSSRAFLATFASLSSSLSSMASTGSCRRRLTARRLREDKSWEAGCAVNGTCFEQACQRLLQEHSHKCEGLLSLHAAQLMTLSRRVVEKPFAFAAH